MTKETRYVGLVDEPSGAATLETWERWLAELKSWPDDVIGRRMMIKSAKETIAWIKNRESKKARATSPVAAE
ncbi:MAG: hypothetical protein ACRECF_04905 [Methyloceanibacter sp.]